jgi:hypothetical protein
MVNILSIRCGVALVPYLLRTLLAYERHDPVPSQVYRQAASGLILREEDGLYVRFQGREAHLDAEGARHYLATILLRSEVYDVVRLSDEVILASIGQDIFLSHPQSEMWVPTGALPNLLAVARGAGSQQTGLPDWLTVSGGDGRLLLSDQRSGRWVLLGSDHLADIERRRTSLHDLPAGAPRGKPPVYSLKGVTVHLQSAFKLAATLEAFAGSGSFEPYEEMAPQYCLGVARSVEGMQLIDSNLKTAMTQKEASKWASILRGSLASSHASQLERGSIRTVIADAEEGRWVLQWGDEILLTTASREALSSVSGVQQSERLTLKRDRGFYLALEPASGNCVALTAEELQAVKPAAEWRHSPSS